MYQLIEQYVNAHPFIYGCCAGLALGFLFGWQYGYVSTMLRIEKAQKAMFAAIHRAL